MSTPSSEYTFSEIVVANLGPFSILVPTDKIYSPHNNSMLGIPIPRRVYSESGWAFEPNGQQVSGFIQGLKLTSPFPDDSPFTVDKRLAQGVPVSFELSSVMPFSEAIASLSLFQYQFQGDLTFHYSFFQNLKPTFVRIYPFQAIEQFPAQVARCIHEELQVKLLQRLRLENENNFS